MSTVTPAKQPWSYSFDLFPRQGLLENSPDHNTSVPICFDLRSELRLFVEKIAHCMLCCIVCPWQSRNGQSLPGQTQTGANRIKIFDNYRSIYITHDGDKIHHDGDENTTAANHPKASHIILPPPPPIAPPLLTGSTKAHESLYHPLGHWTRPPESVNKSVVH